MTVEVTVLDFLSLAYLVVLKLFLNPPSISCHGRQWNLVDLKRMQNNLKFLLFKILTFFKILSQKVYTLFTQI